MKLLVVISRHKENTYMYAMDEVTFTTSHVTRSQTCTEAVSGEFTKYKSCTGLPGSNPIQNKCVSRCRKY